MLFDIDINNFLTAIMSIVGTILTIEKVYKWVKDKFNYAHNKVNENEEIKETIKQHVDEIKKLQTQNELIMESIRNLLRNRLKHDCLKYIAKGSVTQDELEEYEETYNLYSAIGGNGAGKKYHEDVIHLKIVE